jgi:hypothetical protein
VSKKKPHEHTGTHEFEVEGIEEAYEPARGHAPGKKWKGPADGRSLEVERPRELQEPVEHTARIWILERRTRGLLAKLKRWFVGKRGAR